MADFSSLERRGLMLVLASPSGAGKTTISRALLERDKYISLSVSATTRSKRPDEEEGKHYFFRSNEEFKQMIAEGEFLEYARVFGDKYYGTPKKPVYEALEIGNDILFDIDWQGTQKLKEVAPHDVVTVYILPPSREELESRLRNRAQDSDEEIKQRMAQANNEISHYTEYDYIVVNKDLDKAINKVYSILKAERMRRTRLTGLNDFVRELTNEED